MRPNALTRKAVAAIAFSALAYLACDGAGCAQPAASCSTSANCLPLPVCATGASCPSGQCIYTSTGTAACPCFAGDTRRCDLPGGAVVNDGFQTCVTTGPSSTQWGACTPTCVVGELRCTGNTPQRCDATQGWVDVSPACSGATPVCSNGACIAGTCTDGALRCKPGSPSTVQVCASNAWGGDTPCGAGQLCSDGACVACIANTTQCVGPTQTSTCQGGAWGAPVTCPTGQGCLGGACVPVAGPAVCTVGDIKCDGNNLWTCLGPDLPGFPGGWSGRDCTASGRVCAGGLTPPDCVECQPGDEQNCPASNGCNGKRFCKTAGAWTACEPINSQCPPSFGPANGGCAFPVPGPAAPSVFWSFKGDDLVKDKELASAAVPAECGTKGVTCTAAVKVQMFGCTKDATGELVGRVFCEGHESAPGFSVEVKGPLDATISCEPGKRIILKSLRDKPSGGCGGGDKCDATASLAFSATGPTCVYPP